MATKLNKMFNRDKDGVSYYEGLLTKIDSDGKVSEEPALFINRTYFDHLRKYVPCSERAQIELKAREEHRLQDLTRSKEISKDWPDARENIVKAAELEDKEMRRRDEEAKDKLYRQMAWDNRATERKILADTDVMRFWDRPEVMELHRAYMLSQVLDEERAQIDKKAELKNMRQERREREEEKMTKDANLYSKELERKTEEKASRNKKYWEEIAEQVKNRREAREAEKLEKLAFDLKTLDMINKDMNEGTEERVKKEKVERLVRDLTVCSSEKEMVRLERVRDDEELCREIKADQDAIHQFEKAMKERDHFIPGEKARKAVQKGASILQKKLTEEKIEVEKRIFERGKKDLEAREEERRALDERRQKEGMAQFMSVNDQFQKDKAHARLQSQKKRNLERLQQLKLIEEEKKRESIRQQDAKVKQAALRAHFKEQTEAKAVMKRLGREDLGNFLEAAKAVQDKRDRKFMDYAKELIQEVESQGKDNRPLKKVVKSYNRRLTHKEIDMFNPDYSHKRPQAIKATFPK